MSLSIDVLSVLPKVVLHDHLDGGLRPATVLELAREVGHELPASTAEELGAWFASAADSGSLEQYLETFAHTVAVMQTEEGLRRVAREAVIDLAADGVVYAEQRYAPEQHLTKGLSLQDVVDAVQLGFEEGIAEVAADGKSIRIGTILTAMRMNTSDNADTIAQLALDNRDNGVVGFDIAGAEIGFPPSQLQSAFDLLHRENFPVTIHAGESDGVTSMWEAVQLCHADRLGHGLRVVDDIALTTDEDDSPDGFIAELGDFANWVRDKQIPLELCPSSNIQTGAATSIADHPITLLKNLDFNITLNTDNRLMSATTVTREMALLVEEAGWNIDDLLYVTANAVLASFMHHDNRQSLLLDVILPAYDMASETSEDS